jgi:hypothetical protein
MFLSLNKIIQFSATAAGKGLIQKFDLIHGVKHHFQQQPSMPET